MAVLRNPVTTPVASRLNSLLSAEDCANSPVRADGSPGGSYRDSMERGFSAIRESDTRDLMFPTGGGHIV